MSMKPFKVYIFILQDKLNVWNFFEYVDNFSYIIWDYLLLGVILKEKPLQHT